MADDRLIPAAIRDDSARAYNEMLDRYAVLGLEVLLVNIIDLVPAAALPFLLEQFHVAGVEGGALAETDQQRRELIKGSIGMHKKKGTPGAMRRAIRAAGCGEVEIVERPGEFKHDGSRHRNGLMTHGQVGGEWAVYSIIMQRPFTRGQADLVRSLCEEFAPARSQLRDIVYLEVPNRHNGAIRRDNSHTHGSM